MMSQLFGRRPLPHEQEEDLFGRVLLFVEPDPAEVSRVDSPLMYLPQGGCWLAHIVNRTRQHFYASYLPSYGLQLAPWFSLKEEGESKTSQEEGSSDPTILPEHLPLGLLALLFSTQSMLGVPRLDVVLHLFPNSRLLGPKRLCEAWHEVCGLWLHQVKQAATLLLGSAKEVLSLPLAMQRQLFQNFRRAEFDLVDAELLDILRLGPSESSGRVLKNIPCRIHVRRGPRAVHESLLVAHPPETPLHILVADSLLGTDVPVSKVWIRARRSLLLDLQAPLVDLWWRHREADLFLHLVCTLRDR